MALQISAGGGGKEEKEYMYGFAPSQAPGKSKNCKPFLQSKWSLGRIGNSSSGKLSTSEYLHLFEFTLKRMENTLIWAVCIASGQVWGEAAG